MNWTKIPTDLIKQRIPDNEILAIVKYQLLWADLEYQPDDETALRYITNKQLMIVKRWLAIIETQVTSDINSVNKNRNNRKISYRKNKGLEKNVIGSVSSSVHGSVMGSVEEVDKIRLDKIRKEKNKEKKYAFEGKVIKLNQADYDSWKEQFNLLDLDYELKRRDIWLASEKESVQKKWFVSTQQRLLTLQKEEKDKKEYVPQDWSWLDDRN